MTSERPRLSIIVDPDVEIDLSAVEARADVRRHCPDRADDVDEHADIVMVTESLPAHWRVVVDRGDLRWIHFAGIGVDELLPVLRGSDIVVTNARGSMDTAISEYVLALVLAMAKGLPRTVGDQSSRTWERRSSAVVQGARAVVVGAGTIGRATAHLLQAVGIDVSVVGRRERLDPGFGRIHGVERLTALTAGADFLVLAAPLTSETRHLIGADVLATAGPGCHVINVGRGELIDEIALIEALDAGRIAGAALDVFAREPLPIDHRLWAMEQVIVSPHMSGETPLSHRNAMEVFVANLDRFVANDPLLGVVDTTLGYVPGRPADPDR